MSEKIHVFEAAGLGKAPFKFIGAQDDRDGARYGRKVIDSVTTTKPGGSCAFCGNYIVIFCWVEDATGKRFKVGSECVNKTGDKGLKKKVSDAKKEMQRQKREALKAKAAKRFDELFPQVKGKLEAMPHPNTYFAEQGKTYLDYMEFCGIKHINGKARFVKELENLVDS